MNIPNPIYEFKQWLFGDIEQMMNGKPLTKKEKWVLGIKVATLVTAVVTYPLAIIFESQIFYYISLYCYISFLIDYSIFIYNCKRAVIYQDYQKLFNMAEKPKNRWGR